jgi:hypothetical protein
MDCFVQAAKVAMRHQRHRMHEVVSAVSERLLSIGRAQAAAELHEAVDDMQGMYLQLLKRSMWPEYLACARGRHSSWWMPEVAKGS